MSEESHIRGMHPQTRQRIILVLGALAALCLIAEIVLVMLGEETSEAIMSVASVCAGALAGALLPGSDPN